MASRVRRITALIAALAALGAAPGGAQARAITLFAQGGGYSALSNLNTAGTADFKLGFNLGGGVGVQIDSTLEARVTLVGAQSQLRSSGAETGAYLNQYYIGADLKAQYPLGGVTAFGFAGAGAVVLHEKGTTGADKTQGFAHVGLGVAHAVGKSPLSVFAQGDLFFYSMSGLTAGALSAYSKAQPDLAWSGGVSYRLPL